MLRTARALGHCTLNFAPMGGIDKAVFFGLLDWKSPEVDDVLSLPGRKKILLVRSGRKEDKGSF